MNHIEAEEGREAEGREAEAGKGARRQPMLYTSHYSIQ